MFAVMMFLHTVWESHDDLNFCSRFCFSNKQSNIFELIKKKIPSFLSPELISLLLASRALAQETKGSGDMGFLN